MLSSFSCASWPSVCLLCRNVYLGLLPVSWLGCLFSTLTLFRWWLPRRETHGELDGCCQPDSHGLSAWGIKWCLFLASWKQEGQVSPYLLPLLLAYSLLDEAIRTLGSSRAQVMDLKTLSFSFLLLWLPTPSPQNQQSFPVNQHWPSSFSGDSPSCKVKEKFL